MDVTIVIATYGAREWLDLGTRRAVPSAFEQGVPVVYVHGLTLHGARNAGLAQVQSEHVVFLDADDELAPGYCETLASGTADLRVPAVQYVAGGRPRAPYVPKVAGHTHDCIGECFQHGNFAVIGTMARTELLREAGGFEDFAWSEDWALWARCWKAGATVETIADAVYIAHVNPESRNRAPSPQERNAAHWAIHHAVWPELHREAA